MPAELLTEPRLEAPVESIRYVPLVTWRTSFDQGSRYLHVLF